MLKNNIEKDIKVKCIEESKSQLQLAESIGTSPAYVNRMVRSRENIVNRNFIAMLEALGYDVELTYVRRNGEGGQQCQQCQQSQQ